jgi:hypothetical protein
MTHRIVSTVLVCATTAVFSQGIVAPLFPLKNGSASQDSLPGHPKELVVDAAHQSAGWIVFKWQGIAVKRARTAMLTLYIRSVSKPGLCGIHILMTKITVPENSVKLSDLKFDDMPIASVPLDSSFSDQMLLLDITELIKSKTFKGIAIRPIQGLSATFISKEGYPPPAVLLTFDTLNTNQAKWFNNSEPPEPSTGKEGDFFIHKVKGVVYHKSSPAAWDSVASLTIPPEPPVVKVQSRKPVRKAAGRK